jgi:hypothetical protein
MVNAFKSSFGRINEAQSSRRDLASFDSWWDKENQLFLRVFSGEVMQAFKRATVFRDTIMSKTLTNGKSMTFPRLGRALGRYHTPGTPVIGTGNRIAEAEREIYVDDLYLADVFVYVLDELKESFAHRAPYATALGEALAQKYDRNICKVLFSAAADLGSVDDAWSKTLEAVTVASVDAAASTVTLSAAGSSALGVGKVIYMQLDDGGVFSGTITAVSTAVYTISTGSYPPGWLSRIVIGSTPWTLKKLDVGSSITGIDVSGSAGSDNIVAALFQAVQTLTEKDVPVGNLTCVVTPETYFKVVQSSRAVNTDFNPGGNGSYASGTVARIAGLPLRMSNNLAKLAAEGQASRELGERNPGYAPNMTKAIGVVYDRSAAGSVILKGIESQVTGAEVEALYQGTVLISRMACGHGALRPEACCSLFKA